MSRRSTRRSKASEDPLQDIDASAVEEDELAEEGEDFGTTEAAEDARDGEDEEEEEAEEDEEDESDRRGRRGAPLEVEGSEEKAGNDEMAEEDGGVSLEAELARLREAKLLKEGHPDQEAMSALQALDDEGKRAVLKKFEDAATDDSEKIRNPSGFIRGIIRRHEESQMMSGKFSDLPESVQEMLSQAFARGGLSQESLQERSLGLLLKLDEEQMKECVQKYLDTAEDDIKKPEPFMFGIIRRKAGRKAGPRRTLMPEVQQALDELLREGFIKDGDLDGRCTDELAALDRNQALDAIDQFRRTDLNRVRNIGAFFNGIIRRLRGSGRRGGSTGSRGGDRGYYGGRGPPPPSRGGYYDRRGGYDEYYDYYDDRRGPPVDYRDPYYGRGDYGAPSRDYGRGGYDDPRGGYGAYRDPYREPAYRDPYSQQPSNSNTSR